MGLKVNKGNFDGKMVVSHKGKEDINWWLENLRGTTRQIKWDSPDIEVGTDASLQGWGAHRGEAQAGGRWLVEELEDHINVLELRAILLGLKSLVKEQGQHIRVLTDNTTALAYVKNMGGLRSQPCNQISREIWQWAEENENWLTIAHIPGVENVVADYLSRNFSDSVEWSLSLKIFHKICKVFGKPDIDLFASRLNAKVEKYVSWGPDPNAWKVDAFSLKWTNAFFYVFPPFSLVGRVLRKMKADRTEGVLIAPDWPSQPWYGTLMGATKRKIKFRKTKGNLVNPYARDSMHRVPLVVCRF